MPPATRLRRWQTIGMSLLLLLLLAIILDSTHIIHWPVSARFVAAYPRLLLNRPLYIYDATPPGINTALTSARCLPGWGIVGARLARAMPRTARSRCALRQSLH